MSKLYYGELHEVGGGHPGQLPSFGGRPVDPGYGVEEGAPDQGLPGPPGHPSHPIMPAPPTIPPGVVWPPITNFPEWAFPDQGLPGAGGTPDQGLPGRPGGGAGQLKKVWAFVWIRGYGHRWVVLDISARPERPPVAGQLPSGPGGAQPKPA